MMTNGENEERKRNLFTKWKFLEKLKQSQIKKDQYRENVKLSVSQQSKRFGEEQCLRSQMTQGKTF